MTEVSSAGTVIDLTMDEDGDRAADGDFMQSRPRGSSEGYVPAVQEPDAGSIPAKKSFSSYEIKALSSTRVSHIRLPDILQLDQKKNIFNASQPAIFTAWIQEHEESSAPLTLTNEDQHDIERVPPADWAYTDGYVLDNKSIEPASRRVTSSLRIPKGCNCDNELGICDPRTCGCYALHEKLAPNPWVWQDKTDEAGNVIHSTSDIQGDFAYTKEGRLRSELVLFPGVPLWECNSNCSCSGDCTNRVVQKGRTVPFDLFKSPTAYKGWGIRAKQKIRIGTFISIYAGELIGWGESEERGQKYDSTGTTYILDVDNHHIKDNRYCEPYKQYMKEEKDETIECDHEASTIEAAEEWAKVAFKDTSMTYSVDAGLWGNLSRYFNHSCEPNMNMYPVYTEERDIRRPFLAFFAKAEIPEGHELTFAYDVSGDDAVNEAETEIPAIKAEAAEHLQGRRLGTELTFKTPDRRHNLTSMRCGCGAKTCRGTVFRNTK